MTDHTHTHPDLEAQADLAADEIERALIRLMAAGLSPAAVLAGAHGTVVVAMATMFGPEVTADRCTAAAAKVRSLPAMTAATALAMATPAGRA